MSKTLNFTNHFTLSMELKTGEYRTIEVQLVNDKEHVEDVLRVLNGMTDYNEVKYLIDSGDGLLKLTKGKSACKLSTSSDADWAARRPYIDNNMTDILMACSTHTADFLFMGGLWFVTTNGTTKGFRPLDQEKAFFDAVGKLYH